MPISPAEIKDKLTSALDGDKNVVDEAAVEEVITLLETSTLTKEILEQTRLGREINTIRKTCNNPTIAKRARNLVKAWNRLFVPNSPQIANGQQRISPGLSPAASQSPALSNSRHGKGASSHSPAVQLASRVSQPKRQSSKRSHLEKARTNSKVMSPLALPERLISSTSISNNEDSNISWPQTPPLNPAECSQDRLVSDSAQDASGNNKNGHPGVNKRNFNFDHEQQNHSTKESLKPNNRASDQRNVSKTNVANRKRTRHSRAHEVSNGSFSESPPSKQPHLNASTPSLSTSVTTQNDVIDSPSVRKLNIKSSSISSNHLTFDNKKPNMCPKDNLHSEVDPSNMMRHPNHLYRQDSVDSRLSQQSLDTRKHGRVKTTEQLIEDIQRKSATPVGTNVIEQIRTNQIQKDSDVPKPPVPSTGKKRGRKKKNQDIQLPGTEPVSDCQRLAQTKSEYIERFLQTSVTPTPGVDVFEPPIQHSHQESPEDQPIGLGGCSSAFSQSAYDGGFPYSSRQDKPDSGPSASPPEAREITVEGPGLPSSASLPMLDVNTPPSERLRAEQILARLPHIVVDNIDWTSSDYVTPQPMEVTDSSVQRLHRENVKFVNGTYDRDGHFQRWAEMLTSDSAYDEPLFILPYVMPN